MLDKPDSYDIKMLAVLYFARRGTVKDTLLMKVITAVLLLLESPSCAQEIFSSTAIFVGSMHSDVKGKGNTASFTCRYLVDTFKSGNNTRMEMHGGIVDSVPVNACEVVATAPKNTGNFTWILLATQSECDFDTKFMHAQNAGYSALIIYDEYSDWVVPLQVKAKNVDKYFIFSCFLGKSSGTLLKNNFTYEQGFGVTVIADTYVSSNSEGLMIKIMLVILVASFIASVVAIFGAAFVYRCWPRFTNLRQRLRICARTRRRARRNILFAKALKLLPTEAWQKNHLCETCAICMNNFETGDILKMLNCKHGYHPECIDKWLVCGRRFCPLCQRKVILKNHHLYSNTDSDEADDDTTHLLSRPHFRIRTYGSYSSPRQVNPLVRGNCLLAQEGHTDAEFNETVLTVVV